MGSGGIFECRSMLLIESHSSKHEIPNVSESFHPRDNDQVLARPIAVGARERLSLLAVVVCLKIQYRPWGD